MAVFQDEKTKKWVVKIDTQRNKKRINHFKGGFERKGDAVAYERSFLNELDINEFEYMNMTLNDVYEAYITEAESKVKLTTLWKKKGFLNRYLFDDEEQINVKGGFLKLDKRLNRNMKIRDLTSQQLRKLKNELTSVDFKILGSDHKNKVLGEIKEFFSFANREFSNIKQNVYFGVLSGTFLDEGEIKKDPPVWELEDLFQFLWTFDLNNHDDLKWHTFFLTIWTCHLRIGEILGLRVKDFQNGVLSIRQAVVNGGGLGWRVVKPKTKSSIRDILLDETTEKNISRYLELFTEMKDEKGEFFNQNDFLFSLSDNPIGRETVRRKFNKHVELANDKLRKFNYPPLSYMTIHGLRASGSSVLIDNIGNTRENLIFLQNRMGHSELSITQNHYLSRSKKAQSELKKKLNSGFDLIGMMSIDDD